MRQQNSYNRSRKDIAKKEKILMIASSALVLGALTLTGVYVKGGQENKQDGYKLDYQSLENAVEDELDKQISGFVPTPVKENATSSDLAQREKPTENAAGGSEGELDFLPMEPVDSEGIEISDWTKEKKEIAAGSDAVATEKPIEKELHFDASAGIAWPVSGNVLIPYSMDGTVYFKTLDQYKYSPGMVVSAKEGTGVTASVSGKVTGVFYDDEIGGAVKIDIGDGYEIIYGQLKDIAVKKGDMVESKTLIGYIANPTKYYVSEGSNLYIRLNKDGEALDPMNPSGEFDE